jgi:IS605 OrfB family transposase
VKPRRALLFPLPTPPTSPGSARIPPPSSDTLTAPVEWEIPPSPIRALMDDFRLLVNQCLRETLASGLTSRRGISRYARDRALETRVTGEIGLAAADIALSLAAGHRRRLRHGVRSKIPYVRTPFVRIPAKCFHFDLETGRLRLSVRRGEWTSLEVPVSRYHRSVLSRPGHRVTQVHIGLRRVVAIYEKAPAESYAPTSLVALDTNESSLDGVQVTREGATFVRVLFPELREIQARHFGRRRYLGRKKAHDRRLSRRLLGREGRRERHRVRSRLHALTRSLIDHLAADRSVLVLEDLTGLPRRQHRRSAGGRGTGGAFHSRSLRRRLSSWPQSELHRQLAYKAEDRGVPILWLSPHRTSRTCPRCGEVSEHRRRVGTRFDCAKCGWSLDRQLNAGVNLGVTALRRTAGLGGLRLDPDALPRDAMRLLYPTGNDRRARVERMGREGDTSRELPTG